MTIGNAGVAVRLEKETSAPPQLQTFLSRYFYFSMSLVMAGLVVWGFSKTVDTNLFHANPPRLGFTIAVIMARFDTVVLHQSGADAFLSIPFWDMIVFGTLIALAIYWRTKPEYHRRLVFIASCGLMDAALADLISGSITASSMSAWTF